MRNVSWPFMATSNHPKEWDDPIPTADWSDTTINDCLVISVGADGRLFIPREMAKEFARRVQAAVAVGFPEPMEKVGDQPSFVAAAEVSAP